MTGEPTRVVLVKPGDVLILGNVQVDVTKLGAFGQAVETLRDAMGIRQIVICEDDVSIAAETPPSTAPSFAQRADEAIKTFQREIAKGVLDVESARRALLTRFGYSTAEVQKLMDMMDEADASADYR